MIISAKNCWDGAKAKHKRYFDLYVKEKILAYQSNLTLEIYDFIIEKHDLIRDGGEEDFRLIQAAYDLIFSGISPNDQIIVDAAVKNIFNYDVFSNKCKSRWCAYSLCKELGFKTCPYCNLSNEITLFKDDEGMMRPSLDHFLDKDRYPLFAISLGNLIPSCHHCNSTLKGTKDFLTNRHLNPLYSDESIKILLDVNIMEARYDLSRFQMANIELHYDPTVIQATNSTITFGLLARYQALITEVRDIASNIVEYSTSGVKSTGYKRSVLRNVTKENYRDRVFGKMIIDMSTEYM